MKREPLSPGNKKTGIDKIDLKKRVEELRLLLKTALEALPLLTFSMEDLESKITETDNSLLGSFRLPEKPSIDLIKKLPDFRGGTSEVGIFLVMNTWVICFGKPNTYVTQMPQDLHGPISNIAIDDLPVLQFDLHSHPGNDQGSEQPSDADAEKTLLNIDGKCYISTHSGLLVFERPIQLPGGFRIGDLRAIESSWSYWINSVLKLTEEMYNKEGGYELKKRFYNEFFGLRVIPWNNKEEIANILN